MAYNQVVSPVLGVLHLSELALQFADILDGNILRTCLSLIGVDPLSPQKA